MFKKDICKICLDGCLIVKKAISKEISFIDFVKVYGDLYHFEALDGHEANEFEQKVLEEFKSEIDFHRCVQEEVLDLLYLGSDENKKIYSSAGRLDEKEAESRLSQLAEKFEIQRMLLNLEKQYNSM